MEEDAPQILLIEDEESLSSVVELNLKLDGFKVTTIANGQEAINFTSQVKNYDLVILDVMLPGVSGWDICTTFKKAATTPILFMSAKGNSSDKIQGLKLGADDYLGKPFDLEELLLRVQVLISRTNKEKIITPRFLIGGYQIDISTYEVFKEEKLVTELTKRDIELLEFFRKNKGKVLSRNAILEEIWGVNSFTSSRTIDNYILNFRKLFEEDPKHPKYFHSIRGVGYKFTNT